jgi:transposase
MGVSYRQAKRLWRSFKRGGATALRHRQVGRASNRGTLAKTRQRVLALIRQKYSGDVATRFGPTLVAEHLASEDDLTVDHETLRRWMLAAGLWSRQRKRSPYRQRRERKAHFGELVQLDGSFHAWFEARGPRRCLITMVDDATSRSDGRFSDEETIWAAAAVLRRWIEQHGVPLALYTDWKNVYVRAATTAEQAAGLVPLTQFGRMCAALQIQIIPASSPQAKGRVERNHGTHQDRLVKKLRRLAIADDGPANAFLETTYWPQHNARFPQAPASAADFHRRCPSVRTLDRVFRLEATRTVGHDWVVRYANRALQLARQSGYAPARSTVTVWEWPDGHLAIEYRGRAMQWTDITGWAAPAVPRPAPVVRAGRPRLPQPRRPSADHPWSRGYEERAAQRRVRAPAGR